MARPPQDPQIRINQILNAAQNLFYTDGYRMTPVSRIVKAVGVTQGTFYYYFRTKEDLIEALIARHLLKFRSEMEQLAFSKKHSPQAKVELTVSIVYRTIHVGKGLFLEYLYADQYIHLVDKFLRQGKTLLAPLLIRMIEEGCQKNIFADQDPAVMAHYMISASQGFVEAIYSRPPQDALDASLKTYRALVEKTLGLPEGALRITWKRLAGA